MRERVIWRESSRGDGPKFELYELRRRGLSERELTDMLLHHPGLIGRV